MVEKYVHDYKLHADSKTEKNLRNLYFEHTRALNEASGYVSEFMNSDYEDYETINRIRFMLKRNVFEYKNDATRNVIERVGARLTSLPCQDLIVRRKTQTIRELWKLIEAAGLYYGTSGKTRAQNRKEFYEILEEFKSKH